MKEIKDLTTRIEKEGGGYEVLCSELDLASEGARIKI